MTNRAVRDTLLSSRLKSGGDGADARMSSAGRELSMENKRPPVQSIDRLFDIIEVLSEHPRGMALTDLACRAGLHASTTHRLLASLSDRGYVQKDAGSGKYRLTIRMFEIGSRVVNGMNLLSVSRPYLEHLAELTGETIHLVVRDGNEVVYLYKEDTRDSIVRMGSFVGLRSPMYCTGVGKSILAYLPESEVFDIWRHTAVTRFTAHTIVEYSDLIADLVRTRQQGWAVDREEHELGVLCVAAPVLDFRQAPIGAISISAPSARMSEEKIIFGAKAVCSCAKAISGLLGRTGTHS